MKKTYDMQFKSKIAGYALLTAGLVGFGAYSHAGEVSWDFSSDPADDGIILSGNNDEIWVESGGNPGGFLAVTYPEGGQTGFVAFPSIDADDKIVSGFKLEGDVRIGNSTGPRAADGFSVSLARDNGTDPVIEDLNTNGTIGGQGNFAGGIAEGGTTTGVAISFDTWQGNTLPDGGDIKVSSFAWTTSVLSVWPLRPVMAIAMMPRACRQDPATRHTGMTVANHAILNHGLNFAGNHFPWKSTMMRSSLWHSKETQSSMRSRPITSRPRVAWFSLGARVVPMSTPILTT
jgi:hypothetical protein